MCGATGPNKGWPIPIHFGGPGSELASATFDITWIPTSKVHHFRPGSSDPTCLVSPSSILLTLNISSMRRYIPQVAERILHACAAVAIRLVLWFGNRSRAGGEGAPVDGVAIGHVEIEH
jgi:hypothetical protein